MPVLHWLRSCNAACAAVVQQLRLSMRLLITSSCICSTALRSVRLGLALDGVRAAAEPRQTLSPAQAPPLGGTAAVCPLRIRRQISV